MTLFVGRSAPRSLYDSVSEASSAVVIREYSSSFGLASRLLGEPVRTQVRNIYALVRVADEIVDNPDPTLDRSARATMLDWLEGDVAHAMRTGYSGNLVVHAFARSAGARIVRLMTRFCLAPRSSSPSSNSTGSSPSLTIFSSGTWPPSLTSTMRTECRSSASSRVR